MELSRARLEELFDAEAKLQALEAGGVDNWNGIDSALERYWAAKQHQDNRTDLVVKIMEVLSEGIIEPAGSGCGYGFNEDVEVAALNVLTEMDVTFGKGSD